MEKFNKYDIFFSGLSLGKHFFEFDINQKFFEMFQVEQEFTECNINVRVLLNKSSNLLTLKIKTKGKVNLICDISQKEFPYKLKNVMNLIIKFSSQADFSDDVITLAVGSHQINVAQYIYESIVLSIPMKRIHPNYEKEIEEQILNKYLIEKIPEKKFENIEINPIWEKLKSINKKDLN